MRFEELFSRYSIPYATEGSNCKEGWVNIQCPFCNDSSNHLGGNIESGQFNCWRCGPHNREKVLVRVLGESRTRVQQLIREYGGHIRIKQEDANKQVARRTQAKKFKFPPDTGPLKINHIHYLKNRGFDPKQLTYFWRIQGTGPGAWLDDRDYRFRLVVPIYWDRRLVSYQTRDVTDKSKLRYMACPKEYERIPHQDIIYCHPDIGDTGICVEGITDVWRLGKNAFCTFGMGVKREQIRAIANKFERVIVVFDNETQAQRQADKLVGELAFRGVDAESRLLEDGIGDPADMTQTQVETFLRTI